MFISGFTENESRSQFRGHDLHFQDLLSPLHVVLTTPAGPEPREIRALEAVERIARSQEPVWISAEVGAGGVWLAQLLHDQANASAEAPFIREDCEPGRAPNLADGRGTLFLCGPERLSPAHQSELVDYVRRSDMRHLEGLRTIPPFPRVIAWSLTEVSTMAESGQILPALAQALGRTQITVPPLRAQRESIDNLARAILEQIAVHEGLILRRLTPEALAALRAYPWPGNLTELHSLLERACLLADPEQAELDASDLPLANSSTAMGTIAAPQQHRPRPMSEIEAEAIRASIDWNSGNLVRAARELRIGRATLYRKLKKYGIPTRAQRRQLAA
jgi:two-component system response regulator PilR (NtrC family)